MRIAECRMWNRRIVVRVPFIPHSPFRILHLLLARPERIELPTCWFEASRSIRLSYGRPSHFGFRIADFGMRN